VLSLGTTARRALEVELREETELLDRDDRVIKAVNQRYDVRGSDLSKRVMMCLDNQGKPLHIRPAVLPLNRSIHREIVSKLDGSSSLHHINS
jgi:hypothetical protein